MKKKSLFDSIDVPVPCDKGWDKMIGDDVSRLCLHCEKDIYNISAMTRQEAKKLLFQSKEKVCIRMEREADGRIKTLKKQLHQITRQVPLAAGVLTASLILSGAANAQESSPKKQDKSVTTETPAIDTKITPRQIESLPINSRKMVVLGLFPSVKEEKPKKQIKTSQISFIVSDIWGAFVPNAKIILKNKKIKKEYKISTNDEGSAKFNKIVVGEYKVKISANGYKTYKGEINIKETTEADIKVSLKVEKIIVGMAAIAQK